MLGSPLAVDHISLLGKETELTHTCVDSHPIGALAATINMAYTSAQMAVRTAGNGAEPGIFSPGLSGAFTPSPIERAQYPAFSQTPGPQDQARNNIMNRKADSNSSLCQICMNLKRRLAKVPGFDEFIADMEQDEQNENESPDPVTVMWNMLRQGFPLLTIYNALGPAVPLEVDQSGINETKLGKKVTFKFLEACLKNLHFSPEELFLITDLYGSDTTGFVKVRRNSGYEIAKPVCWISAFSLTYEENG